MAATAETAQSTPASFPPLEVLAVPLLDVMFPEELLEALLLALEVAELLPDEDEALAVAELLPDDDEALADDTAPLDEVDDEALLELDVVAVPDDEEPLTDAPPLDELPAALPDPGSGPPVHRAHASATSNSFHAAVLLMSMTPQHAARVGVWPILAGPATGGATALRPTSPTC
ncbi:MAG: hypothetical protein AB2A00_19765 [Myxococcota bacterium]